MQSSICTQRRRSLSLRQPPCDGPHWPRRRCGVNAPHLFKPNVEDVSAHLHALFPPAFAHHWPDAQIEIVYGPPGVFTGSRWFSAFDLKTIIDFVEACNASGDNV